jgi:MFS transporter, YNFM family, putative membrane transport protein
LPASDGRIAPGSPAWRRLTLALAFAGFSTFSLLYAVQPLLPAFAEHYRLSAEGASLAVSLATGPLAVAILVAGTASDRLGRRPLMVAAMLGGGVATLAAGAAPGWPALLLLRLVTGIALAGVPSVAMAYVAEEVEAGAVGRAMGLYIAGSALGGMGGRLLASLVADVAGWRWALAAVGVAGLAMGEAFRRLAPPSRRFVAHRQPLSAVLTGARERLADPVTRGLVLLGFALMGVFVTVYNYAAFRLVAPPYRLSQAAVGAVFLLYVLGSFSSGWFGRLADRYGRGRVLPWPIALLVAGVAVSAARPLPLLVLGIALVTIGFFGAHSIASAGVSARASTGRGQAAALYLFAYYMGSSLLGSAGGIAWTHGGWPGVAGFCGVLGAVALLVALGLRRFAAPLGQPQP